MKKWKNPVIAILVILLIIFLFRKQTEMLTGDEEKKQKMQTLIDYVNTHKTTLSSDPFFIASEAKMYVPNQVTNNKLIQAAGKNDVDTVIAILKYL